MYVYTTCNTFHTTHYKIHSNTSHLLDGPGDSSPVASVTAVEGGEAALPCNLQVQCAVCSVQGAVCSVQCAVYKV